MALTKAKLEELITAGDVDALTALLNAKCVMKVEWTNLSPTSSFAAQTILLDLSDYDAVLVIAMLLTTAQRQTSDWCMMGGVGVLNYAGQANRTRVYEPDTDGVVFSKGERFLTYGTASDDNTGMIPYKIIGIKFSV